MADRTPRDQETREQGIRKRAWTPPSLLPNPNREEGYSYRWIRKSILGQADDRNMMSKQDEGWVPVKREDHSELQYPGKTTGLVEIGGLVLCKTPEEFVDQRNQYFRDHTDAQTRAVDANLMKENDPRMPLFSERKSTTSRGRRA
jgi:hypothetical protein